MSVTMDLSPLKVETSSAHSSPHRTPVRPSPMGSPSGNDMDITLSYTSVGFGRNSDPNSRSSYSKVGFDGTTFQTTSILSNSPQAPAFCHENPLPSPVLANALAKDDSENAHSVMAQDSPNQTPTDFLNQRTFQQQPHLQQHVSYTRGSTKKTPYILDGKARSSNDHVPPAEEEPDQMSTLSNDKVLNEDTGDTSTSETAAMSEDMDNNTEDNEKILDESVHDEGDSRDSSDKDDDQIECGECSAVFSNLQTYMDHTCYRSQVASRTLTNAVSSPSTYDFQNEEPGREVESFQGKIIFKQNGSAYIIEGSSQDSNFGTDLNFPPDSIVVDDGQSILSIDGCIPRLQSVAIFPRRDSSSVFGHASKSFHQSLNSGLAVHRFYVFGLGTREADRAMHMVGAHMVHKHSTGPHLMCIICKLVFVKPTSFVNHAIYYHSVDLSEPEKVLLCRNNSSVIIHVSGPERQLVLSVLHPMIEAGPGSPGLWNAVMSSRRKLTDLIPNGGFMDSESKLSARDYEMSTSSSLRSSHKSHYFEQQKLSLVSTGELHPGSAALKQNIKRESYTKPSPPASSVISDGEGQSANHHLQAYQALTHESLGALRLRSSPSVPTSAQRSSSSPSSSGSDSYLQASSSIPNMLMASMPPLVMSTANSSNIHTHLNLSSASSSSLQAINLQMPHFLCTCDEHPQGRAQGVECPKCDMILSSSQSLGGHMTMTHSRNSCKTLKCPKCNWHYKYQETLEIHMKEKHLDTDAQCVYCLTSQAHPRLARGESYSCGYKPYRCEVCNYSTTTKGNLSIHMQSDKHINNMQDLANGGTELKIQQPQPPSAVTVSSAVSTPLQTSTQSYPQDDCQLKKMKQKQSFRCDVCSYETSVARNLRIHMTSEKHTHNMLVMTQNINHLHQDITLHQMSQMNQLLAINQQEQAARFAAISSHLPSPMFSYESPAMLMSSGSNPSPSGYEIPINLSKENGIDEYEGPVSKKDATKMFQCCICYKYGSDSMENVHNHIQYDRTKCLNSDAYITFSSGTHHCNLCSYKTHLKANFQLHCKTDKHLQKLQLVNHIMEGGSENEWKLNHSGSTMQICCNACSFYANSIYKMQLHLSTIQHESCAQLFRHLQLLDHATSPPAAGKVRYYQCSLCAANVHTKQKLVMHSRSPQHVRNEQSLPQGHVSIFDVYLLKDMAEGEIINFDDEADELPLDNPDGSEYLRNPASNNNYTKVTTTPLPHPGHGTVSAAGTAPFGIGSSISTATDYSLLKTESNETTFSSGHDSDRHPGTPGLSRSLALASRNCEAQSGPDISSTNLNSSSTCSRNDNNIEPGGSLDCRVSVNHCLSSLSDTRQGASSCILCPLCRHECADASLLEKHLVKQHSVAPEGVQRLMSMVEMPATASSTMASSEISSSSLSVPFSHADSNNSTTVLSISLSPSSATSYTTTPSKAEVAGTTSKQKESQKDVEFKDGQNGEHQLPAVSSKTVSSTGSAFLDDRLSNIQMSSQQPSSPSSPSSYPASLTSYTVHVTSSPASICCASNQSPTVESKTSVRLSPRDENKEINLHSLEAEHANLLANEGIDLSGQDKLDKEYEELFRCQTCSKSFSNIDHLYSHQNELGHLELKQTPRGPGYLCWRKGCNQYFKTASTLQVHFREIHAMKSLVRTLSPRELDLYKFKCRQCSFTFKTLDVMQKHTLIHLMQSVTQCRICSKRVNSVHKMRRHLETDHGDLSLSDMTAQMESIETNAGLLFSSPAYEQFTSELLLSNGNIQSKNGISNSEKVIIGQDTLTNGLDMKDYIDWDEDYMDDNESGLEHNYQDKQFLEDYMNSQPMAEEHYRSIERKFKCHRCRMGFTNQRYLFAHNKTTVHRKNDLTEHVDDPGRPYRCAVCKESFTQKSILLVHYNSVSHLHKMKQQTQVNGESLLVSTGSHLTPPPLSPSPKVNSPSTTTHTNGSYSTAADTPAGSSGNIKPYKCNICKVSYNNQPSIEIHLRSVGHKTKASKLGELIQSGQVDVHQALIEHPDPRTAGKQQAQIIADMIHQQATAQAVSNAAASYFNLQGMSAVAQLSLLGLIPPTSHYMLTQNALAGMSSAQLEAYFSSVNAQFGQDGSRLDMNKMASSRDHGKEKPAKSSSHPDSAEKIVNMVIKHDGKIELAGSGYRTVSGMIDSKSPADGKVGRKDDDLPPNFHAPIIARPRGFMGRFKPQLHRSLLENFGFECVMHFNEESSVKRKDMNTKDDDTGAEDENVEEKKEKEDSDDPELKMEIDDNKKEKIYHHESVTEKVDSKDNEPEIKDDKKDENKENIDLPELSKCHCQLCHKDFSNVWVLKNHEEEVHNNFVSPEVIEDFGQKFREGWEKNLPKPVEQELIPFPQPSPTSPTPTAVEYITSPEMPPPPPPSQPQLPANFDMSQLLPLMSMNLLPMHLPMNLVNLGLQSSLIPSLMMSSMDLSSGFLQQMPPPSHIESPGSVSSQQQLQAAAAAAAQNQKRVRTRISDDQLKVLRQYFDINNSPSEEQINKMSDQTGLPQKVIKHWFRNTLFKERQRNKDSPYNFNNPPSTSIDLDEYDRTGKIPEVKVEPEEEEDGDTSLMPEIKKETQLACEENIGDKNHFEQDMEMLETVQLKIDLMPNPEPFDETRKDQESHSSSSSPSMSSIPSTPTTSGPATPTPVITSSSVNTTNPLTFSLDAYAANMVRLEAATLQSMGKRANRTRFTDYQIKTLQDYFERNAYPKDDELEHLSKILGLSARVIVVWFQNARQKARKVYENQPSNENVKDTTSPFQRTQGLNYQCKKCNSVFQRYYELIKHQKSSCVGESNNNKPIPSLIEDDSNFSYSNDDSNISELQSTPSSGDKNRDLHPRSHSQELSSASSTVTAKIPSASSTPVTASSISSSSSSSSSMPFFKCDKCNLTFSRFDMWQDHQKAHTIAPAMYTPFSSSSAFKMLQTLAHQEDSKTSLAMSVMSTNSSLMSSSASAMHMSTSHQPSPMAVTPAPSSTSPSPSSKRKTDSEDESGEQPRDKRLRTTILPEQLDYLYQQYQIDCNPSRKQLEHIANTVNLKKRVVQVWFQNTRARERKGHYRAHQQLINKRCPFCRALFRAKSALESHLATKHPEEMAKGDINIDLIPDAIIEPPNSHVHSSMTSSTGHGVSSTHTTSDISKLLPPVTAASMPNYMAFISSTGGLNLPFPGPTPELLGHPSFEDPYFKKYMNDLANSMAARQEQHSTPSLHGHPSASATVSAHATHKPQAHQATTNFSSTSRPHDAHKPRNTSQPQILAPNEDAPLDLSKPVKPTVFDTSIEASQHPSFSGSLDFNERPMEMDYLRRLSSMDDSFSETLSEMADHEYMNDIGNSPPSPSHTSNGPNLNPGTPCSTGKRYRTQMSAVQVKVMKHLFQDYKTPTMAECELLGQEIGLAKRVVQVWFQNARAKEKKAKLNSGKPFNAEIDFPKSPEECKLCNYKYTHKVTVQDHIFTKAHIDRVKSFINSQSDRDPETTNTSLPCLSRSQSEVERGHKMWDESSSHIAQLQAMGINPATIGYPLGRGENSIKSQEKESQRKEKKPDAVNTKDEQQAQAAMEMSMNAQMLSAMGSYMPSLDPSYLSYMYGGLSGYFPGMGLPIMQPGLIPDHMLAYDPLVFGTPLALLQIPEAAIKSVSEKLTEAGALLARYTQDCQALADLHSVVTAADLTVAAEATLDVGYICKKCQMVYPARESCVAHQRSFCLVGSSTLPKGFEPTMKLEQVQYECRACSERYSTILEFKSHCQQEAHKQRLMKFKAKEAARREAAGSPSSSAPYASSASKVISPSPSYPANPLTSSPSNNNNSSSHNNNQVTAPGRGKTTKPAPVPSPAHQYYKVSPSNPAPSVFRDKYSPAFNELADLKRLKAE